MITDFAAERLLREGLISLADAAALLPTRAHGRTIRAHSLARWCESGKLEALKVGRHWWTSRPAVARCLAARTRAAQADLAAAPAGDPEIQRRVAEARSDRIRPLRTSA